jgi:hypothetical protein
MSKITIEFDGEEEAIDARTALDGYKWKGAMWDLDQLLRGVTKYGSFEGREATAAEADVADALRDSIRRILNEYNLNLED